MPQRNRSSPGWKMTRSSWLCRTHLLRYLPKNAFAFRDLAILTLNPADIRKLTVTRAGRTDELEPSDDGRAQSLANTPADRCSRRHAVGHASDLPFWPICVPTSISPDRRDPRRKFGLDRPLLEIAWETDRAHRLKVGAQVRRAAAYYATVDDQPFVFTLKAEVLKPFEAEFRDHMVMSFPLARAERILLRWSWPRRTVAIRRRMPPPKGQPEWVGEPGSDVNGIDLSRMPALVTALSHLETGRYAQYDGEIQPFTGLTRPRLTIEVKLGPDAPARVLRIGDSTVDGQVFAAEGSAHEGPVFLLPAPSWDALIKSGERFEPLPANVFAPAR